ncbi:MAG: hypothetical protein AB7V36_06310 [Bacteroidales bacterium]|jgi:hypothetical protein
MKDLPDFVLNKEYENYYLLDDQQEAEIRDQIFYFSSRIGGKEILVDIRNLAVSEEYKQYQFTRLVVSPGAKLDLFKNKVDDRFYLDSFVGHYYLNDDTNLWEFYYSALTSLCIFACNNEVKDIYEEIFNPYEENTIKQKLDFLFLMVDEKRKNEFVEKLYENYHWK